MSNPADLILGDAPRTHVSRRSILLGAAGIAAGAALTSLPSGVAQAAGGRRLSFTYYAQQTSYSCSAASTRMALTARGVFKSEATLRSDLRLGTGSSQGLDDISYLVNTLDKYTGGYYSLRQWPMSSYSIDGFLAKLSADVKYSVDRGFGVLMNVDKINDGPNNPRPSAGHYIAVMGYTDTQFLIADPFTAKNSPGFWAAKNNVKYWNKLRRYVSVVNVPATVNRGPKPPYAV